jgi:pimeloyl-ACP methyl ester carboxylesterase
VTQRVSAPYVQGRLEVGDGHSIHWEIWGNPNGKPAVVLHGGPGSGASSSWTDVFDLAAYRVVLFDLAGTPGVLIRGARDPGHPIDLFWHLARHWPQSELVVIDNEGHRGGPATSAALTQATDRFANTR